MIQTLILLFSTLIAFGSSDVPPLDSISNVTVKYDYEFYPITPPVCLNVPVQKKVNQEKSIQEKAIQELFSERFALGNERCLPADENCRIGFEDCCGFYDCLERNCGCGAAGYPLGYGKKYCQIFSNYPFSGNGNKWRDATLRCLQRSLIPFSQCPPTNCSIMKSKAFDSHPFCYTYSGVCFLSPKDLLGIIAITYGDVLTLDGIKQILETFKKCGLRYMLELEIEIVSRACELNEILGKVIFDLWRDYRILPDWILTSSVWELKSEKDEMETWKLKVSLVHTNENISPELRYDQLIASASNLVDFSNSQQFKEELLKVAPDSVISIQSKISDDFPVVSQSSYSDISLMLMFTILFVYFSEY